MDQLVHGCSWGFHSEFGALKIQDKNKNYNIQTPDCFIDGDWDQHFGDQVIKLPIVISSHFQPNLLVVEGGIWVAEVKRRVFPTVPRAGFEAPEHLGIDMGSPLDQHLWCSWSFHRQFLAVSASNRFKFCVPPAKRKKRWSKSFCIIFSIPLL